MLGAVLVGVAAVSGCTLLLDFDQPAVPAGDAGVDGGLADAGEDAAPDPNEPNDDFAAATPITPGTHGPYRIEPKTDADFYVFTVETDAGMAQVAIELFFSQAMGDLDLYLYSSANLTTPLAKSEGFVDNERIPMTGSLSLDAGTYYIKVASFMGTAENQYTLSLTVN